MIINEDAIDQFIDDAAAQCQLKNAGNELIMDDGCDFERVAGKDYHCPKPVEADCDHVRDLHAEYHHDACDDYECDEWPYESPFDDDNAEEEADEVQDELEDTAEDELDGELSEEELFGEELDLLDDLVEADAEEDEDDDDEDDDSDDDEESEIEYVYSDDEDDI